MTGRESTTENARVLIRLGIFNKSGLADELGISRPTLDTRFVKGTWKRLEAKWIDHLHSQNIVK